MTDNAKLSEAELEELVFLCRASGEGSHNVRVCQNDVEVQKFYGEMFGEDFAGDAFLKAFRDPDEWAMGLSYEEDLYNAKFECWKVYLRELESPRLLAMARDALPNPAGAWESAMGAKAAGEGFVSELDYDAIMNQAKAKARAEALLLYPDHLAEQRRKAESDLTLRYFRQMYYPQR